ncbi:MAG: RpiB/LacA/LacB family sugar-phosphate isomerase, partial [Eggerthellaceae bacterium]|nr:RpiB/LacA/LacB family sugar-phosphate isomerase [Eggerthellaceae bacterium]
NNANVICLSARFVSAEQNEHILDLFFSAEFAGGRHETRVKMIDELDCNKDA